MRIFHPYYLLLFMVAAVMMVFSKINKHSFYHYYFEVIEEVESRNSQPMAGETFSFGEASSLGKQMINSLLGFLAAFWPVAFLLFIPAFSAPISPFRHTVWPQLSTKLYRKFEPSLAP